MFKLTMLGVFLLKGFLVSGYFAFFHGRPRQVQTRLLEAPHKNTATELNSFLASNPDPDLDELVSDLNWIIRNDYQRDIRVKRIIHQDLKSLVEMSKLLEKLERNDEQTWLAYNNAIAVIGARASQLRRSKDKQIREEILLLGEMIERNDR